MSKLDKPADFSKRHDHGPSTVYGTAMNYVVLRLLGVDKDVPMMTRARATLHALGESHCLLYAPSLTSAV
jgi:hypothetical protein